MTKQTPMSIATTVTVLFLLAQHHDVHALLNRTESLPKAAPGDTPWDELRARLSDPNLLQDVTPQRFHDQCLEPFIIRGLFVTDGAAPFVTNYELLDHPLCVDHAMCVYEDCAFDQHFPNFPEETSPFVIFDRDYALDAERLSLPAMTLEPQGASDIVHALQFCAEHQIGVSIKVAGHSYFGASSEKGTLLLKMSTKYPQYAIEGSLYECDGGGNTTTTTVDLTSPNAMACAVAQSRNKPAVLRVGGGELFDHVYRAVSIDWNSVHSPERQYHVVGGGAGTVSAAGGWMASGGLSGTTGMRLYGIGIDQVVHIEAVLPKGQHVRFGPTAWEAKEKGYPRTTEVTGFCNKNATALDESEWVWEACDDDSIDFGELWFAFRGGGGGTYGVLTSLHYQLHEYPGMLSIVGVDPLPFVTAAEGGPNGLDEATGWFIGRAYVEFVLQFLYAPAELNVTDTESRGCSSAHTANMNVFNGGIFFCYGPSGDAMALKWREKIENQRAELEEMGFTPEMIDAANSVIVNTFQTESYAHLGVSDGSDGVPAGRLRDEPRAGLVPLTGPFPNYADSTHTHFPLATFESNFSAFVDTLAVEALTASGPHVIYAMGGAIPESDDGLNSLSPTRRQAAFLKAVTDEEYRGTYYSWFFPNTTTEFPGSSCHNHANVYDMGPLKSDWTKPCPAEWSQEERVEQCISQQEAAWGTVNLNRLEEIKAKLDPDSLFICTSGVGHFKTPTVYTSEAAASTRSAYFALWLVVAGMGLSALWL